MSEKRRGLGRGLGALIPSGSDGERPVDVFFPPRGNGAAGTQGPPAWIKAAPSAGEASESDGGAGGVTTIAPPAAAEVAAASVEPSVEPSVVPPNDSAADPDGLLPVPGARFAELAVGSIRPNARQPRTSFDEEAMAELVESIREIGVLQPIVVRAAPGEDGTTYELIMGERRWRATQAAGLGVVPAIIRDTDDADLLRDALLENLHRSNLNPLEEAAAYRQLLDDFGCTHEELAARISRSRPQISNTLRLLRLPPLVQRRLAAGVLSAGHARALLGLTDGAAIERLAQRIVAEGLSVRATEEIVSLGGDLAPAPVARRARAGERNEALDDLATRLSDRFETKVKIALGKSKGRLTVEFASVQDLNRILETLSPQDPGLLKR
ncbi:ParB/RepB/Spo0J family partition protein [Pengzhenrongella sicca]|uniref:ParB/RepB/Spo0J family partition protein n=1 Tax=Pengzhenrongella sicca TaxID=2819238 RepID=A0A8A4ZC52_9MICO|nr:ParB/RepB/Spo0J family partition protein [Pengzhenrongella sicca]QTE29502.1 ParB/RepB/Spo0J family partition protein [Pengzhenrongella sicca]